MNLQDFASLAAAQAYKLTSTKKLSADLMRSFLNQPDVQLYNYFRSAISDALPTLVGVDSYNIGDLKVTTFDNLKAAGEFNFITGHPSDQTGLVDILIFAETDAALKAQLTNLKNWGVGYCNKVTYPFALATQAEFNLAKLHVVTAAHTITLPAAKPYLTRLNNSAMRAFVYLDVAAVIDTQVLIYTRSCSSAKDPTVTANYIKNQQAIAYLNIKKGELGGEVVITKPTAQYLMFECNADTQQQHQLTIELV